jgi:hypothetical protein
MPDALVDDDRRTWTTVVVAGEVYARLPVRTRWLEEGDDLATVLKSCVPRLREDDTVVVSEKVAVLLTGRSVPLSNVRVGATARLLARFVQPRSGSRGLSVPAKMQFVLDEVGWLRLVVAACVSAVTRPVGLRGLFYRVAGPVARDLDGGRPPYEDRLFPPLPPAKAAAMCAALERSLGAGVAVIDMNDFGGTIRARSPRALPTSQLLQALSDNPLGQRLRSTPFAVVRAGVPYAGPSSTSPAADQRERVTEDLDLGGMHDSQNQDEDSPDTERRNGHLRDRRTLTLAQAKTQGVDRHDARERRGTRGHRGATDESGERADRHSAVAPGQEPGVGGGRQAHRR